MDTKIVKVFAVQTQDGKWVAGEVQSPEDTHTAILTEFQELKSECVEHEPDYIKLRNRGDGTKQTWTNMYCHKCGVKLKAKWEVAD